jgi:hypothetical protein
MIYLLNNILFDINIAQSVDGVNYPPKYFASLENQKQLGLVALPDPIYPDPTLYTSTLNSDGTVTSIPIPQADLIGSTIISIDADVDAVYQAVIGSRGFEYLDAEKAAISFKAAGYTGPVPSEVQSWANAKQVSAPWIALGITEVQWAADDILTTATAWRSAQDMLRAQRLSWKEAARLTLDGPSIKTVQANWAAFLARIRIQLKI